jgi:hypothetical protein
MWGSATPNKNSIDGGAWSKLYVLPIIARTWWDLDPGAGLLPHLHNIGPTLADDDSRHLVRHLTAAPLFSHV